MAFPTYYNPRVISGLPARNDSGGATSGYPAIYFGDLSSLDQETRHAIVRNAVPQASGWLMKFPKINITDTRFGRTYYYGINRIRRRETWYGLSVKRGTFDANSASALFRSQIASAKPLMVARYGATELGCVLDYLQRSSLSSWVNFLAGNRPWVGYRPKTVRDMKSGPGFFPVNEETLGQFSRRVLEDSTLVDVLGTWMLEEKFVAHLHPVASLVPIQFLEPFWGEIPWTSALAGKRVLVIHPFAKTVEAQYRRRQKLFKDERTLPEFELITMKAIQTMADESPGYNSWFAALAAMSDTMAGIKFDVALIGCGAYGFSLAAQVKRMGKQAFHLGGATQLLFGIIGTRWLERPEYKQLMNEFWTRPSEEERPSGFMKVEKGCYW